MNIQIHTGRVEYVEPLCGHAKRCLLSLLYGSEYEGTWKADVEVKAGAGNVWRNVQQLHGAMTVSYTHLRAHETGT